MKGFLSAATTTTIAAALVVASCSTQSEKPSTSAPAAPMAAPAAKAPAASSAQAKAPAPEKTAEKAKASKASGDVGLVDLEKNYMILVTKEGKLITLDFDNKTKAIEIEPTPAKIADVGLGSSATVMYEQAQGKNIAKSVEFKPAKGE